MINALYLGPYRYNNFFGISGRNIIEHLSGVGGLSLTTKNIFLNDPYLNKTLVNYDKFEKNEIYDTYDIVIEHCYPKMMTISSDIGRKFIAIPIIDYFISKHDAEQINQFDQVLTDDELNLKVLTNAGVRAEIFDYSFQKINSGGSLNIEYHNLNKKICFIGDYEKNINLLNKIIVSFIISFRKFSNVSLVLILTDDVNIDIENKINKNIHDIFNKMDFHPMLNPIKIITQQISLEQLHLIHSSIDVYLDIQDSYATGINRSLSLLYNNPISSDDIETIKIPMIDLVDGCIEKYKESILTASLISALTNMQNKKKKKGKTIADLLCI